MQLRVKFHEIVLHFQECYNVVYGLTLQVFISLLGMKVFLYFPISHESVSAILHGF